MDFDPDEFINHLRKQGQQNVNPQHMCGKEEPSFQTFGGLLTPRKNEEEEKEKVKEGSLNNNWFVNH